MSAPIQPRVTARDRAEEYQLAATPVTAGELRAAARVLAAIADVDIEPLAREMTTDGSGNPITGTPEQLETWSTYVEALEVRDRAEGWARTLSRAAVARDLIDPR